MTKPDITSLVSWYALEEDGGTAYDSHRNFHMTQHGGKITRGRGKIGYCRNFEKDTTHYLLHESLWISGGGCLTLGMWIKPESIGSTMNILDDKDFLKLRITGTGILEASLYDGAVWNTAQYPTPLLPATWYFVTVILDAASAFGALFMKLQVNSGTEYSPPAFIVFGSGDILYGNNGCIVGASSTPMDNQGYGNSTANYFDGKIDELFVFYQYSSAMSADEIAWLYNGGAGRSYYDLNAQSFMAMF
jgi:hypothetical protein